MGLLLIAYSLRVLLQNIEVIFFQKFLKLLIPTIDSMANMIICFYSFSFHDLFLKLYTAGVYPWINLVWSRNLIDSVKLSFRYSTIHLCPIFSRIKCVSIETLRLAMIIVKWAFTWEFWSAFCSEWGFFYLERFITYLMDCVRCFNEMVMSIFLGLK